MSIDWESGASYNWIVFLIFIIVLIGIIWVMLIPVVNGFVEGLNPFIAANETSLQTKETVEFNLNLFWAIPVIGLAGFGLWMVLAASNYSEGA